MLLKIKLLMNPFNGIKQVWSNGTSLRKVDFKFRKESKIVSENPANEDVFSS